VLADLTWLGGNRSLASSRKPPSDIPPSGGRLPLQPFGVNRRRPMPLSQAHRELQGVPVALSGQPHCLATSCQGEPTIREILESSLNLVASLEVLLRESIRPPQGSIASSENLSETPALQNPYHP
jgi:hypothetical protein